MLFVVHLLRVVFASTSLILIIFKHQTSNTNVFTINSSSSGGDTMRFACNSNNDMTNLRRRYYELRDCNINTKDISSYVRLLDTTGIEEI